MQSGTGINVTRGSLHKVNGYKTNPFARNNRNHYDDRNGAEIAYLIMHYTVDDFKSTVDIFTEDKDSNRVSAHYVITQAEKDKVDGGKLLQVVPDDKRAWHAGISYWQNNQGLNAASLGIEHVNKGFTEEGKQERRYYPFDKDQIRTSGSISKDIVDEYDIPPKNVLGHADIAPTRKDDPGPFFPWAMMYNDYGVGAWLSEDEIMHPEVIQAKYHPKDGCPSKPSRDDLLTKLKSYGYYSDGTEQYNSSVIKAFKDHFSANQRPDLHDDKIREEEMFWAWALDAKYK